MVKLEELRHLDQLEKQGNFNKVLHEAEKLEKKYTELGMHQQLADALIAKVKALMLLGRLEETRKVIKQCEHVLTFLEEPEKVKKRKAYLLRHKGNIFFSKHDLKRALEYYQQSLALAEEIEDKRGMFGALNNIGETYGSMGDLKLALNYTQQARTLSEEIGDWCLIAGSLTNLGYYYFIKSDLDQAKNLYQQALKLGKEHDHIDGMAWTYLRLGVLSWELGDLEEAFAYFEQSYPLFEKSGIKYGIIWTLFYWFCLAIEMNSLAQVQHNFQCLQQLHEQEESKFVQPLYHLAQAMFLKTSPRVRDKAKAQNILVELVEEEFPDVETKIMAMLTLCESLLDEVRAYENQTVFQEALEIAQQVYSLAQKTRSISLTIKLLLLQAKFTTVEGDITAAVIFIEQAKTVAKDKGLGSLAARADAEKLQLETQLDKWHQLIQSNAPIRARFEQAKLEEYLREAKRAIKLHKFQ